METRPALPVLPLTTSAAVPPHLRRALAAFPRRGSAPAAVASGPRPAGIALPCSRHHRTPRKEEKGNPANADPAAPRRREGESRREGRGGTGRGRPALPRTGPVTLTSPAFTPPGATRCPCPRPGRGAPGAGREAREGREVPSGGSLGAGRAPGTPTGPRAAWCAPGQSHLRPSGPAEGESLRKQSR